MKRVAPSRRASARSRSRDPRAGARLAASPRGRWDGRRAGGRWAAPARGAPPPGARATRSSCRSSTSPASQPRCHTAKSAYCTGSSGERRGLAAREGLVQRGQLAEEHAHAPAVGNDVVHRQQQHVLLAREPQQRGRAAAGPRSRSKGRRASSRTSRRACASRAASGRGRTGRPAGSGAAPAGRTTCTGSPPARLEDGAQRLVPAHDLRGEAALQHAGRPAGRAAAGRAARCRRRSSGSMLVDEPEPLLGERQRQRPLSRDRHQRREGGRPAPAALRLDARRQPGRAGRLEERPQRHLHPEGRLAAARPRAWPAASAPPARRSRRARPRAPRPAPPPRSPPPPPRPASAAPRSPPPPRRRARGAPAGRSCRPASAGARPAAPRRPAPCTPAAGGAPPPAAPPP